MRLARQTSRLGSCTHRLCRTVARTRSRQCLYSVYLQASDKVTRLSREHCMKRSCMVHRHPEHAVLFFPLALQQLTGIVASAPCLFHFASHSSCLANLRHCGIKSALMLHLGQVLEPPQSTSVSFPFRTVSEQLHADTTVLSTRRQSSLMVQCRLHGMPASSGMSVCKCQAIPMRGASRRQWWWGW